MSSNVPSRFKKNRKIKVVLVLMGFFVALPILAFMVIAAQGFVAQAGNATPYDVVSSNIQKSSASISWYTDKNTQAVVEYGVSPTNLNFYAPEVEKKKEHLVELTLLTPATTYYYQISIDGTVYDNDGVPWTFTTKTKDGEDVTDVVKGISTRISAYPSQSPTPTTHLSTASCDVVSCAEIQKKLGQGCSASDYFKCLSAEGTPKPNSGSDPTVTPTPSPVAITSSACQIRYLQIPVGKDCTEWEWEPFNTMKPDCRDAFSQYVFQCSSKSFTSTNTDDTPIWYYNNAITNMSTNKATLNSKPPNGSKIYCQVRAEDDDGNVTSWVQENAVCSYPSATSTPTPTP